MVSSHIHMLKKPNCLVLLNLKLHKSNALPVGTTSFFTDSVHIIVDLWLILSNSAFLGCFHLLLVHTRLL